MTLEQRQRVSEGHKGENNPAKRPEVREKIRLSKLGKKRPIESVNKTRAGLLKYFENGGKHPKGMLGKVAWNKGIPRTEEVKQKLKKANIGKRASEETKRKISETLKKTFSNPEIRAKISGENAHGWKGGVSSMPKYYLFSLKRRLEAKAGRPKPLACEVCNSTFKICYDHNHKTDKFRGWLCHHCNVILGLAKDNPDLLIRLANYLKCL